MIFLAAPAATHLRKPHSGPSVTGVRLHGTRDLKSKAGHFGVRREHRGLAGAWSETWRAQRDSNPWANQLCPDCSAVELCPVENCAAPPGENRSARRLRALPFGQPVVQVFGGAEFQKGFAQLTDSLRVECINPHGDRLRCGTKAARDPAKHIAGTTRSEWGSDRIVRALGLNRASPVRNQTRACASRTYNINTRLGTQLPWPPRSHSRRIRRLPRSFRIS